MPSHSEKQRKFMWLVHGIQKGKVSPDNIGGKAKKAANTMNPEDVKDFLMQECGLKECGTDSKLRILKALKELAKPDMKLEFTDTPEQNVIASTKTLRGDYDQTLKMYRGIQFTVKEFQAIKNFASSKPTKVDKFFVKYDKADSFDNNTDITIKKLQEGGSFLYVAFIRNRSGEEEEPESPETGSPVQKEDEIKIIKSTPIDDQEGSEILTNFVMDVYHKNA
jgi:hypothetical protein